MHRRDEPDPVVDHADRPFRPMQRMVVEAAEQNAVVQVGATAISVPPVHVMGFRQLRRPAAARSGTATVAFCQGDLLRAREQALFAAEIENFATRTHDNRDDAGRGRQFADRFGRDRLVDAVDSRRAELARERVEIGAHDHGRGGSDSRLGAPQRMPAQIRQCVGAQLADGAGLLQVRVGAAAGCRGRRGGGFKSLVQHG